MKITIELDGKSYVLEGTLAWVVWMLVFFGAGSVLGNLLMLVMV